MRAELVVDCRNQHGEGIFWNPADGLVWWTYIEGGALHSCDPVSRTSGRREMDGRVCCFAPRRKGGLIVAYADRIAPLDAGMAEEKEILAFEPDDPETRLNDGRTDRAGRFVVGGMNEGSAAATSSVLSIGADHRATRLSTDRPALCGKSQGVEGDDESGARPADGFVCGSLSDATGTEDAGMGALSFSRIGVTFPDLERAVAFYSKAFGMYVVMVPTEIRHDDSAIGRMCDDVFGEGWGSFRIAHLSLGDGIGIELFEFPQTMEEERPFEYRRRGLFQCCIQDENIEERVRIVESLAGRRRMSEVRRYDPGEQPYRMVYMEDLFGNVFELYSRSYELTYSAGAYV